MSLHTLKGLRTRFPDLLPKGLRCREAGAVLRRLLDHDRRFRARRMLRAAYPDPLLGGLDG